MTASLSQNSKKMKPVLHVFSHHFIHKKFEDVENYKHCLVNTNGLAVTVLG